MRLSLEFALQSGHTVFSSFLCHFVAVPFNMFKVGSVKFKVNKFEMACTILSWIWNLSNDSNSLNYITGQDLHIFATCTYVYVRVLVQSISCKCGKFYMRVVYALQKIIHWLRIFFCEEITLCTNFTNVRVYLLFIWENTVSALFNLRQHWLNNIFTKYSTSDNNQRIPVRSTMVHLSFMPCLWVCSPVHLRVYHNSETLPGISWGKNVGQIFV